MSSNPSTPFHLLKASYDSPTNDPFTHTQSIPAPKTADTAERVAYLSALRKATANLQEHINKELTARMEDDKAREAADAVAKGKLNGTGLVDEGKEEENYGEEVVEDED